MALTDFSKSYTIKGMEYAYTTTSHAEVNPGGSIPLYIPSLMSGINSGSPKISSKTTKGSLIFKNAPKCKPSAKRVIKTQNYVSPSFSRNQSWDGISKGDGDVKIVPRKTKVLCTSVSGTAKKMNFGTDYS